MLSIVLFGSAFAACTLPAEIDPNGACVEDANGFSTIDADSDASIPISLAVSTKAASSVASDLGDGATVGTLSAKTDDRYILSCPQTGGLKTVQLTVTRPASYTEFGAEWVQMFPKDSWANTTNEYEPFTFNEYGAKIPLPEFRPTSGGLENDAANAGTLEVFMEVAGEGDYEFKYGNPQLVSDSKWVAVEFKSTLLRVGSPFADCTADTLGTATYSIGSIMPVLFGGPNTATASKSLVAGSAEDYDAVIAELSGVSVPVKVVLEIFTATKTSYTDSAVEGVCYKAGNACPESHSVCDASHCEIDLWKAIIANFKAASAGMVTVLGSVDASTTTAAYAGLGVDGFYFTSAVEAGYTGTSVLALGAPLFDASAVDDATVYVTLASSDLGIWNPFSWYPSVSPSKWAAMALGAADETAIDTLVDRGYGYVYLTSASDFSTFSTITAAVLDKLEAVATRRLQESDRRLTTSEPFWGCDDTLFECTPICMKQSGPVTTKVANSLCTATPLDQCSCKCYHAAQWTCEGDSVVCKAKYGEGELETVGDKVCETRSGFAVTKPASVAELRVAQECTPITDLRGSAPTSECIAEWKATATAAPETSAPTTADATTAETTAKPAATDAPALIAESFAATAALAALALFAA
jgi:hypothetical protein